MLGTEGWSVQIPSHISDGFLIETTSTKNQLRLPWRHTRILIYWHFFKGWWQKYLQFIMFLCLTITQNRMTFIMTCNKILSKLKPATSFRFLHTLCITVTSIFYANAIISDSQLIYNCSQVNEATISPLISHTPGIKS